MTKDELAGIIKTKTTDVLSKNQIIQTIDAMIDTIKESKDEPLAIKGFGKFQWIARGPREFRNPRTGEKVMKPDSV